MQVGSFSIMAPTGRQASDCTAGALIGAACSFVPNPWARAALGAVGQGVYNALADKVTLNNDPIKPLNNRPEIALKESRRRLFLSLGKGALTGLASSGGWMAGVAAGTALGTVNLPVQQPVEKAGNVVGLKTMEVPELWRQGITGKGVGVAVIDTGCAPHPDLNDKVVVFKDIFSGKEEQYDTADHHGTGVCTLIAGSKDSLDGKVSGVAPDAHLAVLKVTDSDGALESFEVLKALKWVEENREKYNLQVVNMSFGLGDGTKQVSEAVQRLAKLGILVSTSAGNDGPKPRPMDPYKTSPGLLTVASSDAHGTADGSDDTLSTTSSRPRPGDPEGPDLTIPGMDMIVGSENGYQRVQDGGTSFATALNSGVMALWKQALPEITIDDAQAALKATAVPLNGATSLEQGHGEMRALAGLEFLRKWTSTSGSSAP